LGGLPAGVWPIVASSSFFALLHLGHGPDPIPLVVFAAMLGYVYRQTHRLAPSIVTHLLLNSCSLVIFWLSPS
jgi:membrane protease YdiL (CAAX protease family)